MSRFNLTNPAAAAPATSSGEPVEETRLEILARFINRRNKFAESFNEIMHKLDRDYQLFCLKDYFVYLITQEMSRFLSLLDMQLDKMESILQETQTGSEQRFDSEKNLFENSEADTNYFLKKLSECKIDNEGFKYFIITEEFKKDLANKKEYTGYAVAFAKLNKFIAAVDEYRKYFNHHNVMPETMDIRFLIDEIIRYQIENYPDPGLIVFLQFQLYEKVGLLEKSFRDAERRCEVMHQNLKNVIERLVPKSRQNTGLFFQTVPITRRDGSDDDEFVAPPLTDTYNPFI